MPRKPNTSGDRYNDPFPTNLRHLMKEKKITQDVLAQKLGVKNRQSVTGYIDGSTVPTIDKVVSLADFFGVSSDYLLGLSDIRTNDKDLTGVCEYTGLTTDAVWNLRVLSDKYPQTLSEYLSDIEFILYIAHLGRIREMANEINSFLEENRETKDFTDADIYTGMGKVLEMETNLKAALYDLDNSAKTARLNIANVGQLLEKLSEEYSKRLTQAVKTMDCDNG